jgi:hypothetical protein
MVTVVTVVVVTGPDATVTRPVELVTVCVAPLPSAAIVLSRPLPGPGSG